MLEPSPSVYQGSCHFSMSSRMSVRLRSHELKIRYQPRFKSVHQAATVSTERVSPGLGGRREMLPLLGAGLVATFDDATTPTPTIR